MSEFSPKAEAKDMELVSMKSVLIAVRVHPFPSRTRQLSSLAPKILGWRRPGKIGSADTKKRTAERLSAFFFAKCFRLICFLTKQLLDQFRSGRKEGCRDIKPDHFRHGTHFDG